MTFAPEPNPSSTGGQSRYAPTGWENQPVASVEASAAPETPAAPGEHHAPFTESGLPLAPSVQQAPMVPVPSVSTHRWEQPPMVVPNDLARQERSTAGRCHWLPLAMNTVGFGWAGALMMFSGSGAYSDFAREHARQSMNLHITNVIVFVTMILSMIFNPQLGNVPLAPFVFLGTCGWFLAGFIAQIVAWAAAEGGRPQALPGIPIIPKRKRP